MKTISYLGSLLILFFGFTSQAAQSTHRIRWVLAHEPVRVFERAAKTFAQQVEQKSKGRLKVEIIDAKTLRAGTTLTPNQAFEMVQNGELEMSQTYTTSLGQYNKAMWVLDLPFLFRNHEHAAKVLDGEIGRKIVAGLESHGVKGLSFTYSGGYRVIPSKNKPLHSIEDFRNLKISVSKDSPIAVAYLKELGAVPVQVQARDSFYQQKGLDGFETTYARLESIEGNESKYINETEHSLFLTTILINQKFFLSLPQDLQKIIQEATAQTAQIEREDSIRDGLAVKEKYIKKGLQVVQMKKEQKAQMQKLAKKVHQKYETFFEGNLIAEIQKIQ